MKKTFIMSKDEAVKLNEKIMLDNFNLPTENREYKIKDKIMYGIVKNLKITKLEKDFEVEIDIEGVWE